MSVTAPRGFRAAGVAAGLKASGAPDVALVVNDGPLDGAAAVFTRNRVRAAPVLWSEQAVADGRARAVVLNSGGANACTGPAGFADTHRTAEHVAAALDVGAGDTDDLLVARLGGDVCLFERVAVLEDGRLGHLVPRRLCAVLFAEAKEALARGRRRLLLLRRHAV